GETLHTNPQHFVLTMFFISTNLEASQISQIENCSTAKWQSRESFGGDLTYKPAALCADDVFYFHKPGSKLPVGK
ncbi:MAG: hypothetical protein AAFP76_11915, partial [Bacteroidota bacterium]